jgi:pimeloyl-ACP methyl ester carboxylesterase
MSHVLSKDGTPIGFNRSGNGPAVILVDGALCYRASGPSGPLAALLAEHFTVLTYDRRGRGESGDTAPYAIEREVEDLEALINSREAGGSACVYGISSGAALALEAANRGVGITRLALYEAPFIVDDTRPPIPGDFMARLKEAVAADRRSDAVKMFMKLVGVPAVFIALMRFLPMWSTLKGVAHTLPYDIALVQDRERGEPLSAAEWAGARVPTLVMDGGKSPVWMRNAMRALANVLPNAEYRTLEGQTHMLKPKAVVPALVDFFNGRERAPERVGPAHLRPSVDPGPRRSTNE